MGGAFVIAVSAALLIGGTGGYLVRAVTSHGSAAAQAAVNRPAADNEDITQSDLTRAQPPSATVPDWVQKYMEKAPASQFKVDDLIENLSYAGTVSTEQVPSEAMEFQP